jgi:hypothetical protein
VLLPQAPPSPPPMELPDSPEWKAAQRYEFTLKDLTQAISAYQAIARTDSKLAPHAIHSGHYAAEAQRLRGLSYSPA